MIPCGHNLGCMSMSFLEFVHELRVVCGLGDSHYVGLNKQVTIFLYMCVTGLLIRHVAEWFQHSNDTISKSS